MPLVIGVVIALGVGLWATSSELDRDRALYPAVLVVVASYYILFAVMANSRQALVIESAVAAVFVGAATVGFRSTLWVAVVGLAAHGLFDFVHGSFISNPGVPEWWPAFCLSYDVAAAGYLAWILSTRRVRARVESP